MPNGSQLFSTVLLKPSQLLCQFLSSKSCVLPSGWTYRGIVSGKLHVYHVVSRQCGKSHGNSSHLIPNNNHPQLEVSLCCVYRGKKWCQVNLPQAQPQGCSDATQMISVVWKHFMRKSGCQSFSSFSSGVP